ncbi:MAG: hypothetical protein JRN52_14595 [Nitrososphaerota archaeon]|nr:hypothetical protein [Nitrososphaerota archaeon]
MKPSATAVPEQTGLGSNISRLLQKTSQTRSWFEDGANRKNMKGGRRNRLRDQKSDSELVFN